MPSLPLGRQVPEDAAQMRVDTYLATYYRFFSRQQWQQRIRAGSVQVNRAVCKPSLRLRPADRVSMDYAPAPALDLHIVYHDEHFVIVNKPSGIPCQPNSHYRLRNLIYYLRLKLNAHYAPVHRLDLETSGLVICTTQKTIAQRFSQLFADHKIKKKYLAIVNGIPKQKHWTVAAPIGEALGSAIRIKKWINPDGKPAITHFTLLKTWNDIALIEAVPITGRQNQIRIHLAHCGHHIIGDKLYHPDERVFISYYQDGITADIIAKTRHQRLCLHCHELAFTHPVTTAAIICREDSYDTDLTRILPTGRHP